MASLPLDSPQRSAQHRSRVGTVGVIRTLVFVVLALSLMVPSSAASRSVGWCRSDPVVKIGDDVADIFLSAPIDAPLKVTGPNEIIVIIPDTLSGSVVAETQGFGKGEKVTIVQSPDLQVTKNGIEVEIKAFVPVNGVKMRVHVEFAPRVVGLLAPDRKKGFANDWIVLKTRF
jgi:hypothetical protein